MLVIRTHFPQAKGGGNFGWQEKIKLQKNTNHYDNTQTGSFVLNAVKKYKRQKIS